MCLLASTASSPTGLRRLHHEARRIESAYLRATANLAWDATVPSSHPRHHTFNYDAHRILPLRHSR